MLQNDVIIVNRLGLHARAAAKFVTLASSFKCDVHLEKESRMVNGKSIMGIMMLAAGKGTKLKLIADGEDEELAVKQICDLIKNRFGEDE